MKPIVAIIALSALPFIPLSAHAQFAKIEDAVKYRQSVFSVMGTHMGRVGAVVKGEKPYDKAALEADAAVIEMMAKLPWNAFPPSSDTAHSKARAEIWKEPQKFQAAAEKLQAEATKLSAAAKAGDLVSVKSAFGAVGQSCKACHDNYRNK